MIQPIKNNVLVKCFEGDAITAGGIIIPESVKEESNRVEIIAVGEGTKDRPMKLKPGDVGYRVKDWGTEVIENGITYYLMDSSAILSLQ